MATNSRKPQRQRQRQRPKPTRQSTRKPAARKPTHKPRKVARRAARKAAPTPELTPLTSDVPPDPALAPALAPLSPAVPMVARRPKPVDTPNQRKSAQNLLDALGGPAYVLPRLHASGDKKAQRLAEMMESADFDSTSFFFKLKSVGMPITQFTELLLDFNQASAIARLVTGADQVAEDILAKALDHFEPHRACMTSGRILTESESGMPVPTEFECFDCQGSGYLLKSAEREWVELYLELIRMRKNAPMVSISNTKNAWQQNNVNFYGDLATPDGAPSIDSIIKRADDLRLPAGEDRRLTDGSERLPTFIGNTMPEDAREVVEAEVVGAVDTGVASATGV